MALKLRLDSRSDGAGETMKVLDVSVLEEIVKRMVAALRPETIYLYGRMAANTSSATLCR